MQTIIFSFTRTSQNISAVFAAADGETAVCAWLKPLNCTVFTLPTFTLTRRAPMEQCWMQDGYRIAACPRQPKAYSGKQECVACERQTSQRDAGGSVVRVRMDPAGRGKCP